LKLQEVFFKGSEVIEALGVIESVVGGNIVVRDTTGNLVYGNADPGSDSRPEQYTITCEGTKLGSVEGGAHAQATATFLSFVCSREVEKNRLLDEILDLYRQINLLYNLADKLATSLEVEVVAEIALEEASRLIHASGGLLLLAVGGDFRAAAGFGDPFQDQPVLDAKDGIIGAMISSTDAEIVNDVGSDSHSLGEEVAFQSMLYTPLKGNKGAIGGLILVSEERTTYTAADLNLLTTLAVQAAPAIEHAQMHERLIKETQAREARLQRQIDSLRIELDLALQKETVDEITESEYFQKLREQADDLRGIFRSE